MYNPDMKKQYSKLDLLQIDVWELYKDVMGFRPRHFTQEEWQDEKFLQETLERLLNKV
jgi:hypothetical protein